MLLSGMSLGCGADGEGSYTVERATYGDTVVIRTTSGQVWSAPPRLSVDLTIGALDGSVNETFGNIVRLALDTGGGIYVFDLQGPRLLHFNSDGRFTHAVSRPGKGPTEYGELTLGMVVDPAGVLYFHDWGNRRILRFTEDGTALPSWPLPTPFLTTAPGRWMFSTHPGRITIAGRLTDKMVMVTLEEGRAVDTVGVPELDRCGDGSGGAYRTEVVWAWHPNGYFVVGCNDSYWLEVRRAGGIQRIGLVAQRLPVDDEEAAAYRRQYEWMENQPYYQAPGGTWVPAKMPFFSDIQVGSDGLIWIKRNTHPVRFPIAEQPGFPPPVNWRQPFLYDVFQVDGSYLGQIRFTDKFEPHLFLNGSVLGIQRGSYDEQYVVRLRIDGNIASQ